LTPEPRQGEWGRLNTRTTMRRRSNNAVVNLHSTWSDERTIADT
jgi:hypothetical protein